MRFKTDMTKLYISTDLGVNSSGGTVVNHELNAMKTLCNNNNNNNNNEEIEDIIQLGYKDIHPTAYNLPDLPLLIDYLALEKLSKIDLTNVDLAHMYGGSFTNTIRMLKSKGIKTTFTLMWHDRMTSISEHQKFFGEYPFNYVKNDTLFNMYTDGIREADIVIAAGSVPRNLMLKEGAKRVEIIPLGCDIPNEDKIMTFPKDFRIGYIGAVGPDKGLYYLIKGWEFLNYQDDSILVFAGSNSEYLNQFIRQHSKTGKYHIMGYVTDTADFYNNISVYIQPSATEGFGMEIPEAMSYGRPVICSDGAGAADCITNGVDGFIVSKMNTQAIADKIDWFKTHPKELIEMGKNAKDKAKSYTWQKTEEKYVSLWNSLITPKNKNIKKMTPKNRNIHDNSRNK